MPTVFTRHVNPSHFKDPRGEGALNKQHNELLAGPHFRRNLSVHLRFIIAPAGQTTHDEPEAPSKRVKCSIFNPKGTEPYCLLSRTESSLLLHDELQH